MKIRRRVNSKDLSDLIKNLPQGLSEQLTSELAERKISLKNPMSILTNQTKIIEIYDHYIGQIEEQDAYDIQEVGGLNPDSAYEPAAT